MTISLNDWDEFDLAFQKGNLTVSAEIGNGKPQWYAGYTVRF